MGAWCPHLLFMSLPLADFIHRARRLFVLTGAGCSTDSGIPDYRDADGQWKRQNVDCLHQRAGSRAVIDLHGRLDQVRCMGCEARSPREEFQHVLLALNPGWAHLDAAQAPDGDADLEGVDFGAFNVPSCPRCGGILKPDVVFFGENVPRERVAAVHDHLGRADAVLVVGSSLMVYSGFRFVQAAAKAGLPVAVLNLGRTRADDLLTLKVEQPCAPALSFLL